MPEEDIDSSEEKEERRWRVRNTRLLSEQPAKTSDYAAHTQIADALYATISSDEKSLSIALVGELGSGKSTIIELLKSKAEGEDAENILVFTYDAWTHSGDSIRRSFIQELIEWLRNEHRTGRIAVDPIEKQSISLRGCFKTILFGWKSDATKKPLWSNQYDKIVRQKQVSTQTSRTVLGLQGALIALATGLLTIGISLLGKPQLRFSDMIPLLGGEIVGYVGFTTTVIAVAIFFLLAFVGFLQWASGSEGTGVYKNEVTSESTSSADRQSPSTFDFRSTFEQVAKEVLVANRNLNLAIVVDNIDRIEPHEVRRDWKLLQTFFDVRSTNQKAGVEWADRLWTIAPFDDNRVASTWSNAEDNGEIRRFVDKTFQMKKVIPHPVYTDWREQFHRLLSHSFGDSVKDRDALVSHDTIKRITEFVDYCVPEPGRPRRHQTKLARQPRDAKRLINDLVLSYRSQDPKEVTLEAQAFHILERRRLGKSPITGDTGDLLNLFDVAAEILEIPKEELEDQIYAIDYGVDRGKGRQYKARREIYEALESGDASLLEKCQSDYDEFGQLLVKVTQGPIFRGDGHKLPEHVAALSGIRSENLDDDVEKTIDRYSRAVRSMKAWGQVNQREYVGADENLAKFLSSRPKQEARSLAESIFEAFSQSLDQMHAEKRRQHNNEEPSLDQLIRQSRRWAEFLKPVINELHKTGDAVPALKSSLRIPGKPVAYFEAARVLCEVLNEVGILPKNVQEVFCPHDSTIDDVSTKREIENHVMAMFEEESETIPGQYIETIRVLNSCSESWTWADAVANVAEVLLPNDGGPETPQEQELTVLLATAACGSLASEQNHLRKGVWRRINEAKGESPKVEAAAILLALLWCADPPSYPDDTYEQHSDGGMSVNTPPGVEKAGFRRFESFLENPSDYPDSLETLRSLAVSTTGGSPQRLRCHEADYDTKMLLQKLVT